MKRFKRWGDLRRWMGRGYDPDPRPYFDATVIFQAADMDEAERLYDAMLDAIGCAGHDAEGPCPHFRVGGIHLMEEERP